VADIVKPKDLAKILENIPENQIANAAEELGVKPEQLTKFVNKPTGKAFEKIAETLGEGVEGAQKFVDKFLQRGAEAVPPKPLALPPAAVESAQALPAVVTPPGPLSPRMQSISSKVQKDFIDVEPILAKPTLPAGQAEAPKMSQAPAQQALEAATAPKPPQQTMVPKKSAAAAAGLGAVVLGAGFSKEANAPAVIKEAQVDKVQDISQAVTTAVKQQAVTPEQQAILEDQAQQLEVAAQSLEDKLTKDYEKSKARVELMRLAETVMNGLVTAIGANALLNKGSPYAVDFSKGPKTDWNSEFDRLQKDYSTQMGAIMQKYKLEATEKRAQAKEAAQESRFQQQMGLREKELEAKQGRATSAAAQKAEEKAAVAKDKAFSELSGALASLKEKSTPISNKQVVANATKLGIPKEEIDLLVSKTTGKGLFNFADEEQVASILEKYRPGQQQAAAPAAPAESDLEAKKRRLQELLAKQKGG